MDSGLQQFIQTYQTLLEKTWKEYLDGSFIPDRLKASMFHSLEAGGKRLRPLLVIASFRAFDQTSDIQKVLGTAIALEMIHTYSLIHDDLPAMDDDDLRRGQPTNHKKFDEATAILAGDALLTYSFQIIGSDRYLPEHIKNMLISDLARASGPSGMVAGQYMDLKAENSDIPLEELERIHSLKTGKLLEFAILSGARVGGASWDNLHHLETFAYYMGLVFQIQDDILDMIGNADKMGKMTGSDTERDKSTYVQLLGLEAAQAKKSKYAEAAKTALQHADADDNLILRHFVDYFSSRDH